MFDPGLKQGQTISNEELSKIFRCSTQGGMRRSHTTNTLIIISDHTKFLYDDKWRDDILHYTVMGQKGDQVLDGNQNRTLFDSRKIGIDVYLFEAFTERVYTYQGRVELASAPYQENQRDVEGKIRKVWMFPLKLVNDVQPIIARALSKPSTSCVRSLLPMLKPSKTWLNSSARMTLLGISAIHQISKSFFLCCKPSLFIIEITFLPSSGVRQNGIIAFTFVNPNSSRTFFKALHSSLKAGRNLGS
jgi:hypothetical protein